MHRLLRMKSTDFQISSIEGSGLVKGGSYCWIQTSPYSFSLCQESCVLTMQRMGTHLVPMILSWISSSEAGSQWPSCRSETHRNTNLKSWLYVLVRLVCILGCGCCARTPMSPQTAVQLEIWKDLQSRLQMMYMLQQWRWWMGLILRLLADCIMHRHARVYTREI